MAAAIKFLDETAYDDPLFKDGQFDAVVGTAASLLIARGRPLPADLLANGELSIRHIAYDNWNGGQNTWCLNVIVPVATFCDLQDRQSIGKEIEQAIKIPAALLSDSDHFTCEIAPELERDPNWRQRVRQNLSGEGITNQGRAHSENVAARQFDNLRFRSRPEIYFYRALKATGIAFAPLSVVVGRDKVGQQSRRIEPDFLIFKDGLVTIVEIDGDLFHHETPHAAHRRLKFLLDEGARLERINSDECDTDEKAREAVGRIILGIEKRRAARV